MKIHRMTATFGKLEHDTITLEPGLNLIQAENEWGKSTWCAFLLAMLYGLDTRAKSTKTVLADKERYAPWSGSPMAGGMDITWKGRRITIERTTRGRIPMGEFRAYETDTGLVVPELTATNCGQLLLGVEQSVFRRAGFIRFSDLPVTQDDSLRRRLNALVTTGDESGEGERLERGLRELKNKCRYNRTGWIPQAEEERSALESKLGELDSLEKQIQKLDTRLEEIEAWKGSLENHQAALHYAEAELDEQRLSQARAALEEAQTEVAKLEVLCAKLPARDQAERKIRELREYQDRWHSIQMELAMTPEQPRCPEAPIPFQGLDLEKAQQVVAEDAESYGALRKKKPGLLLYIAAAVCLIGLCVTAVLAQYWIMGGCMVLGLVFFGIGLRRSQRRRQALLDLTEKYGSDNPQTWRETLADYAGLLRKYNLQMADYRVSRGDLDARVAAMQTQRRSLCGEQSPEKVLSLWQQVLAHWENYHNALREAQRTQSHLQDLQAMAKQAQRPTMEDSLDYTAAETARLLSDTRIQQQRLQNRLGQLQGHRDALGDREAMEKQLAAVNQRLKKLEQTYAALELALDTLNQAKRELQRRFAPRIARCAQELLEQMTGGRYRRLIWEEDFGISAGTQTEDVLHNALWRSDGTVDQLYLALRLAVAEELTPHVPLVLDDALVRFDDERLKAALQILKQMAEQKQILLFTCHSREKNLIDV